MGFVKKRGRAPERITSPVPRASLPSALLVRVLVFGLVAIAGAAWALHRHWTYVPPPMLVPTPPRTAPTYDPDAGELPVPELEE